MVFLCQVSVSVSGNLVTTVRSWELFETGKNTVNEKKNGSVTFYTALGYIVG